MDFLSPTCHVPNPGIRFESHSLSLAVWLEHPAPPLAAACGGDWEGCGRRASQVSQAAWSQAPLLLYASASVYGVSVYGVVNTDGTAPAFVVLCDIAFCACP